MAELANVLLLALLPVLGNFVGATSTMFHTASPRMVSHALHVAVGLVLAIVTIELVPRGLSAVETWQVGLAFGLGGFGYIALMKTVTIIQNRANSDANARTWMIYIAVGVDLFSDGLVIGAGAAVSPGLGLVLAFGQLLADFPEGYAAFANLKDKNVSRKTRLALSAALILPATIATLISFLLLKGVAEWIQTSALVVVAGTLTIAAIEDMMGEAHESAQDQASSILSVIGGFVLFSLVTTG